MSYLWFSLSSFGRCPYLKYFYIVVVSLVNINNTPGFLFCGGFIFKISHHPHELLPWLYREGLTCPGRQPPLGIFHGFLLGHWKTYETLSPKTGEVQNTPILSHPLALPSIIGSFAQLLIWGFFQGSGTCSFFPYKLIETHDKCFPSFLLSVQVSVIQLCL